MKSFERVWRWVTTAGLACSLLPLGAAELFVDDDNFGKAGLTGATEALAYGTIQDAVAAAQDGDVITVLPGTYEQGGGAWSGGSNRVYVTGEKSLTIRSKGGKAVTTIKGGFDPDDTIVPGSGIGPKALRAICVAQKTGKVIVEGFTLTACAPYSNDPRDDGYGGAVYSANADQTYLVDCELTGCVGSRGLTYKAVLVRCSVHDNRCVSGKGSVNYRGKVFNSVAVRNVGDPAFDAAVVVNTTLAGCSDKVLSESCLAVNSVMTGHGTYFANYTSDSTISNCVVGSVYWSSNYPTTITDASFGNVTNAVITQCAAPFEGDFRLVSWSDAIGVADAGLLADFADQMPTGIDLYVDYLGQAIPRTGAINAGAVQETVTPKGGAVLFKNAIRFVGDTTAQPVNYYRHAVDSYPQQWHVTPVLADGQYVLRYQLTGLAVKQRCPLLDDSLWLMPPPAGTVCTGAVEKTSNAFWVDPETGSDEPVADEERGTSDAPFKTLQKAADVCMTPGKELSAVVFAAAGTYAGGGMAAYGAGNRLYCSRPIRFIGRGIGQSIIKGELDLTSDDHGPDGRGANAKRCVALAGGFVQGFTLTDGRCAWLQGDTAKKNDTCGGCAFLTSGASINDCLITNCIAERGSAVYGDKCFRTRIVDCPGGIYNGGCYACVVIQNPDDTSAGTGNASGAYFSTGFGTSASAAFGSGSGIIARYCIADGGSTLGGDAANGWRGNVLWNYVKRNTTVGYQFGDPCFVDKANGDYRVTTASPAFTCATLDDETWMYYTADINGRPLLFTPEGNPVAGAFHNPVTVVSVVTDAEAHGVTISNPGMNTVEPGETLTVTVTDGARHAHGLIVDGEKIGSATYTYVAPTAGNYENHLVTIVPDYSTDWYVNANEDPSVGIVGSDANSGFTPEAPMLTFEKVMLKVAEGDTVHAAAGVYAKGYSTFATISERYQNRARLYVNTARVTIVADDGRDVTFIEGADAETNPNAYGMGEDATRAVCVESVPGVRIKGFTLRKGRTYSASNDSGGGASCTNGKLAYEDRTVFENCCFTNNWGCFGGAIKHGVCVNCTFFCNNCTVNRGVSHGTDMYGCLFDWNMGSSAQGAVYGATHVVNCTFGPHHKTGANGASGDLAAAIGSPNAGSEIRNTVILCGNFARMNASGVGTTLYSCALKNPLTVTDVNVTLGTEPRMVTDECVDETLRPVANGPLVNAGDNSVFANNAPFVGATDVAGGQRVYNATIDIGAFEYDWRADYAAAIGGGVTVTNASPEVELADGKVRLADGSSVSGTWPCGDPARASKYTVTETANAGTLAGAFLSSGEPVSVRSVTDASAADGFRATGASLDWSYVFAASADGGYAELGPFAYVPPPGLVIIVR